MEEDECTALLQTQVATIARELENDRASAGERRTLQEMHAEYRRALAG